MSVYLTVKQIIKSPERALNDIVLDPFERQKGTESEIKSEILSSYTCY